MKKRKNEKLISVRIPKLLFELLRRENKNISEAIREILVKHLILQK